MVLVLFLFLVGSAVALTEDVLQNEDTLEDTKLPAFGLEKPEDEMLKPVSFRADCYTTKKCRKRKGTCNSSSYCNGVVVAKACRGNCTCCIMEPERCEAKSSCISAKGFCMKSSERCPGWTLDGGCKGRDCTCCVSENSCPNGFYQVGNECFKVIEKLTMWDKAREMCTDNGWQLAEPEDLTALASFIYDDIDIQYYFWIGGRGIGETFKYLSGQSVQDDVPWGQHGGNSLGDCLTIGSTSSLHNKSTLSSFDCNNKYYFICEPGCPEEFVRVGLSCYKVVTKTSKWEEAESNCYEQGLTLAEPEDPKRLAELLYKGIGGVRHTTHIWLGARGGHNNNTAFVWNSGGIVPNPYPNNSTWRSGYPRYLTDSYCLQMHTYYYNSGPGPIWEYSCHSNFGSLCEMICPLGFFHIGHHCYKASSTRASSWAEAHAMCEEAHLTLAQPEDPITVANFLLVATGNRNYWIGGRGDGSIFRWSSGAAISSSWAAWQAGNPGNKVGRDDCLKLVPEHRTTPLNSASCSTALYPLCQ